MSIPHTSRIKSLLYHKQQAVLGDCPWLKANIYQKYLEELLIY